MYNLDYFGINNGWVCPQCHRTFAPHISECPYCNSERKTFATTTTTEVNDVEWWQKYLKQSQTGQPVNNNPSTTTATTNIEPNTKITAWNSIDVDNGKIEIGQDGSIMWKGPTPEIHYPSNIDFNIAPWTDWLEAFNE